MTVFNARGRRSVYPCSWDPMGSLTISGRGWFDVLGLCSSQSVVGMMVYIYSVSSCVFQFLFVTPFSNVLFTLFLFPFAKQESPRHS